MRIRAWRFGNECLSFRVEGCGQGGVGVRGFFLAIMVSTWRLAPLRPQVYRDSHA